MHNHCASSINYYLYYHNSTEPASVDVGFTIVSKIIIDCLLICKFLLTVRLCIDLMIITKLLN